MHQNKRNSAVLLKGVNFFTGHPVGSLEVVQIHLLGWCGSHDDYKTNLTSCTDLANWN